MAPPRGHKISSSDHSLFHEALRLASLYAYLSFAYAASLVGGALHLAGVPVAFMLGLQDVPVERAQAEGGWVRTGALSLGTAGVVGLLVGVLVRRCCRLDQAKAVVVTNWHDLFKYTHMGRTITAALSAVLTWRGLNSLKASSAFTANSTSEGSAALVSGPTVLIGAAVLSMATSAAMNFLYFKIKAVHTEYGKIKKRS
eukprot:g10100.t1